MKSQIAYFHVLQYDLLKCFLERQLTKSLEQSKQWKGLSEYFHKAAI